MFFIYISENKELLLTLKEFLLIGNEERDIHGLCA